MIKDSLIELIEQSMFNVSKIVTLMISIDTAPPAAGTDTQTRWNQKSKYLIKIWVKKRPTHKTEIRAVPRLPSTLQLQAQPQVQTPQSPTLSPLAEKSLRFVCQSEWPHHTLSPTKGQANAIARDLKGDWKYADVVYQEDPAPRPTAPLAPVKSLYLYVRLDEDGVVQDVSVGDRLRRCKLMIDTASRRELL